MEQQTGVEQDLSLKCAAIATNLDVRRSYVQHVTGETLATVKFDPRYLLFEFSHNLMLRPSQVLRSRIKIGMVTQIILAVVASSGGDGREVHAGAPRPSTRLAVPPDDHGSGQDDGRRATTDYLNILVIVA